MAFRLPNSFLPWDPRNTNRRTNRKIVRRRREKRGESNRRGANRNQSQPWGNCHPMIPDASSVLQGSPVKLILIRKLISLQPSIQIQWVVTLFIRWYIGNNVIYCHFYVKVGFHPQNKAKVKSVDFSSHAIHAFPFLGSEKNVRFAVREKVRFTFLIRTRKRNKISLWNFDVLFLNNISFQRNIVFWNRIAETWEILVYRTK